MGRSESLRTERFLLSLVAVSIFPNAGFAIAENFSTAESSQGNGKETTIAFLSSRFWLERISTQSAVMCGGLLKLSRNSALMRLTGRFGFQG